MSIFIKHRGEEPTAKDSMIIDQKQRLDQLDINSTMKCIQNVENFLEKILV